MPETYAASGAMVQAAIIVVQLDQSLAFESIAAGNAAGRVTSAVAPGIYLVRTPAETVKTAVR